MDTALTRELKNHVVWGGVNSWVVTGGQETRHAIRVTEGTELRLAWDWLVTSAADPNGRAFCNEKSVRIAHTPRSKSRPGMNFDWPAHSGCPPSNTPTKMPGIWEGDANQFAKHFGRSRQPKRQPNWKRRDKTELLTQPGPKYVPICLFVCVLTRRKQRKQTPLTQTNL
jgi:hypothetical protein